jgi:hypothetical protein
LNSGGVSKSITKVRFCPRSSYAARMTGGKFQGANSADFSDAVNLFTISGMPEACLFSSIFQLPSRNNTIKIIISAGISHLPCFETLV